ncbi:hypothetical protein DFH07DRAFT_935762 [Mycena maculata]|uniref:Uncharacterized protein n=1 Tax=Mycena maculata TaxID=230809 RepID=A0AAD7KAT8_9AGAR|nr:hypothetical protein DFH07DRAFT_935762 [Mycena maculata]
MSASVAESSLSFLGQSTIPSLPTSVASNIVIALFTTAVGAYMIYSLSPMRMKDTLEVAMHETEQTYLSATEAGTLGPDRDMEDMLSRIRDHTGDGSENTSQAAGLRSSDASGKFGRSRLRFRGPFREDPERGIFTRREYPPSGNRDMDAYSSPKASPLAFFFESEVLQLRLCLVHDYTESASSETGWLQDETEMPRTPAALATLAVLVAAGAIDRAAGIDWEIAIAVVGIGTETIEVDRRTRKHSGVRGSQKRQYAWSPLYKVQILVQCKWYGKVASDPEE